MSNFFKAQDFGLPIYKCKGLPLYDTYQFDFFRCIPFTEELYDIKVLDLHNGNLRRSNGRYSKLFKNEKVSYWANDKRTAINEMRKHHKCDSYICFHAYDDSSSTFPINNNFEDLIILDGRKSGIDKLINKIECKEVLTNDENVFLKKILEQKPDCLVYDSHAHKGGENYIFFESGFKKLALRSVKLKIVKNGKIYNKKVCCSFGSDYSPSIENYFKKFEPIAKAKLDGNYKDSKQYKKMVKTKGE